MFHHLSWSNPEFWTLIATARETTLQTRWKLNRCSSCHTADTSLTQLQLSTLASLNVKLYQSSWPIHSFYSLSNTLTPEMSTCCAFAAQLPYLFVRTLTNTVNSALHWQVLRPPRHVTTQRPSLCFSCGRFAWEFCFQQSQTKGQICHILSYILGAQCV